jgi:SOS-response transcriptional repressor LexA
MVSETLGQLLKRLIAEKHTSQRQLAKNTGIDLSYINQLANDKAGGITLKTAKMIASVLGVQPEIFLSEDQTPVNLPPKSFSSILDEFKEKIAALEMVEIPIVGRIPAGYPCVKEECNIGFAYVAKESIKNIPDKDKLFSLVVEGESLTGDKIYPGDRLLIKPQKEVDIQGKIYVCIIGNACTAKHVFLTPEGKYRLRATNDHFEDWEPSELEILGRAIRNLGKDSEL